jgi:hypothetical protein
MTVVRWQGSWAPDPGVCNGSDPGARLLRGLHVHREAPDG